MKSQAPRRRWIRWLRWSTSVVAGLIVLIIVATTLYVHLSAVPAMLTLPKSSSSGSTASLGQAGADGVWNAGPGSIVGWRVNQVLIGQHAPLVGRTDKVWGSITVVDGVVTQGGFTVDMAALTSITSASTRRTVFDVGAYPTASVALTSPIILGAIPGNGVVERFPAVANITMHGVSHVVRFTVSAEHFGGDLYVLADITFPYGDWKISAQGVPFLADLQSPATIEALLRLTQGAGNPPSVTASGHSTAGGFS